MKKYYVWKSDERYLGFDYKKPQGFEQILEKIDQGERIIDVWQDFRFKMENKKKKVSDFPFMELLFKPISERALNCLRNILEPHVEIVPLSIVNSDLKYFGINVLNIYEVDVQRSDAYGHWRTKAEEKVFDTSWIDTFAFPDDKLPDVPIFRLKSNWDARVHDHNFYISNELRELIEKNKLTGLTFENTLKYHTRSGDGKRIDLDEKNKAASPPPRETYQIRKEASSLEFKHYPVEAIGPPVTEERLAEFEKNLPRVLPHDYREFLKQCNGGSMDEENNAAYIQGIPGFTEASPGDEWTVAWFDSLEPDKKDGWDLSQQYQHFRCEGYFPDYCLPIGSDYGGNLILLSLGEEDYGHIYFWDHELGSDELGSLEPDYSHCYFGAKSFTELIDSLHPYSS